MQHGAAALILGLVGGIAGGLGAGYLLPPRAGGASGGDGGAVARPDSDVLARLEKLETAALLGAPDAATLEGRPRLGTTQEAVGLSAELEQAIARRLEPRIEETVERKWEELKAASESGSEEGPRGKPRLSLEEASREVGLSAAEEDDVRRIYKDAEDKVLAILADPDGDIEAVRQDIQRAVDDATVRPQLMQKYLPKVLPKLGDFMAIEVEKNARIVEAVGTDKAQELDAIDIVEARPFGFGGSMRMEARAGR